MFRVANYRFSLPFLILYCACVKQLWNQGMLDTIIVIANCQFGIYEHLFVTGHQIYLKIIFLCSKDKILFLNTNYIFVWDSLIWQCKLSSVYCYKNSSDVLANTLIYDLCRQVSWNIRSRKKIITIFLIIKIIALPQSPK